MNSVKPHIETLAAISAGYRRGHKRLEQLRIKDIRESNTELALQAFDIAYKSTKERPLARKTFGLTKLQRVLFGVDR